MSLTALLIAVLIFTSCGSSESSAGKSHKPHDDPWVVEDFDGTHPRSGGWGIAYDRHGLGTVLHPDPFVLHNEGSPASSGKSARIWGVLGRHEAPWSWGSLNVFLRQNHALVDISRYSTIEFYTRGDGGTYSLMLGKKSCKDGDNYRHIFTAPKEWTKVRLSLDAFKQTGWGKPLPKDFSDAMTLHFSLTRNEHSFDLSIDDVILSSGAVAQPDTEKKVRPTVKKQSARLQGDEVRIILLHHSTGGVIWGGGVPSWFGEYNRTHGMNYAITERAYPADPYSWENYPYDYWNIWIKHAGKKPYRGQDTLDILATRYNVIVWKHCFPVSNVENDIGSPDVASKRKSLENYKIQYKALKEKMRRFAKTRFIVWTGAAQVKGATSKAQAVRAKRFFNWVKESWDEPGDNIYIWDFWQLETGGGLYLTDRYAAGKQDSHPNKAFAARVAPFFARRVVDVIEGRGDKGSLTGQ